MSKNDNQTKTISRRRSYSSSSSRNSGGDWLISEPDEKFNDPDLPAFQNNAEQASDQIAKQKFIVNHIAFGAVIW